jgi:hypothetical protein
MNPSSSPDKLNEIRLLVSEGNKIQAIKLYREMTGLGLKEAKDAVEQMASEGSAPVEGGLPTNASQKSGCFGMVAMLAAGALLTIWCFG